MLLFNACVRPCTFVYAHARGVCMAALMLVCNTAGMGKKEEEKKWRQAHVLPEQEQTRGGGGGGDEGVGVGGVHPNQSTSSPPALSAEGPTDFCT